MSQISTKRSRKGTRWWLWIFMGILLGGGLYLGRDSVRRVLRWAERRHFAHIGDKGPLLRLKAGVWKAHYSGFWTREMLFKRKHHWSRVKLRLLRIEPKRYTLRLWWSKKPRSIRWIMRHTGAIAAINGGLFDPKYRPLGYFKMLDKIHNSHQHHRYVDGVFFQRGGTLHIAPGSSWEPLKKQTPLAFQSAPLLVLDGKRRRPPPKSWKVDRRSALCLDQKGRLLLMSTGGLINGLSFFELGLLMASSQKQGGLSCRSGLNLDGGSSTQWAVRTPSQLMVTTGISTPVFLLVMPLKQMPSK